MKSQNILITAFATSLLLIGTTSCSDSFLDEKMFSNYDPSVNDVNAKLIGLHRQYADLWGMSSEQGFVGCWQVGTDIGSPGDTQGVENPFYQYRNLHSENAGVRFLWQRLYGIINSSNLIISALGEDGSAAAKAEAMFFRAYAYNMLVTFWGDVPLVTVSASTADEATSYVREKVAKVDEQIDSDLTFAIANLPAVGKAKTASRINKDMARQLAGEAYLRIGMRDASFFAKAEQALTPVIEEGNYSLIKKRYGKFLSDHGDYYSDMFRWGNQRRSQGNTEGIWIFEMEYNRDVNGGTIGDPQQRRNWVPGFHKYSGMVNADSIGGRGNGRLRLSNYVKYGLFADGDIRNSNHNIRRILYYNRPGYEEVIGIDAKGFRVEKDKGVKNVTVKTGDAVIPFVSDSLNVNYPHPTKWGAYDPLEDFGYAMVKDWPLMRLGETYMLRAEARFRQNNLQGAAEDINVLRDRAFQTARENTGNQSLGKVSSADINLDFVLDERIRELIAEENRRMTLTRTNTLKARIERNGDKVPFAPDSKVIVGFEDYNALLPIPLTEIQLNKDAVLEQNPGY